MVREFAVRSKQPLDLVIGSGRPGEGTDVPVYPLGRDYPEYEDSFLVAITEQRTKEDIDFLADYLDDASNNSGGGVRCRRDAGRRPVGGAVMSPSTGTITETPQQADPAVTIYEKSVPGRRAAQLPPTGVERPIDELIPSHLLREAPAELPEVSEPEIIRHYNRISRRNFDLDTGFYPLGSCTMKYNPRLNERVAALPGHARLHPATDPANARRPEADVAAPAVAR